MNLYICIYISNEILFSQHFMKLDILDEGNNFLEGSGAFLRIDAVHRLEIYVPVRIHVYSLEARTNKFDRSPRIGPVCKEENLVEMIKAGFRAFSFFFPPLTLIFGETSF